MEAAQPARYVKEPVTCTHEDCKEKQMVHTRVGHSSAAMPTQFIPCVKCHRDFVAMTTAEIIAGPFPMEA
jgi:hypothetical protein